MSTASDVTLSRHTVDGVGRVYFDADGNYYPSVSTVLPDPDLSGWKDRYDGDGDTKHWKDIRDFKANRGTLVHYDCLNEFADVDLWSDDERSSYDALSGSDEWDRYQQNKQWVTDTAWPLIKQVTGISEDTVIDVERYVKDDTVGYAGQFDLLYQDPTTNDTVLADLKTSKDIYEKHKIQSIAYRYAIDCTIDRVEIIRLNPDQQRWEVCPHTEWGDSQVTLWDEFLYYRSELDDATIQEIKAQATGDPETR